jgi:hypothetical protein
MTATTGTTWRLELRQYSILRSGDLRRDAARCCRERALILAPLWQTLTSGSVEFLTRHVYRAMRYRAMLWRSWERW